MPPRGKILEPQDISLCRHGFISVWHPDFNEFPSKNLFLSAPKGWGRGWGFCSSGELLHEFRCLEVWILGRKGSPKHKTHKNGQGLVFEESPDDAHKVTRSGGALWGVCLHSWGVLLAQSLGSNCNIQVRIEIQALVIRGSKWEVWVIRYLFPLLKNPRRHCCWIADEWLVYTADMLPWWRTWPFASLTSVKKKTS